MRSPASVRRDEIRGPVAQRPRKPERLWAMREAFEAWEATMPPIPEDASVSLGYGVKDTPQR